MYRGDGIEARFMSVAAGGSVWIIGGGFMGIVERLQNQRLADWLVFGILGAADSVLAVVVAFIWPQLGWRTGLWFFVWLPPAALGSVFLSWGHVPFNWRGEMNAVLWYALALIGACLGGWIGAMMRRRFDLGQKLMTS